MKNKEQALELLDRIQTDVTDMMECVYNNEPDIDGVNSFDRLIESRNTHEDICKLQKILEESK